MNLMLFCHTAVCRYSVEIAVGEESLCQKLFTLHLSFVNAYKQGIWLGEEFLATLHHSSPLFTGCGYEPVGSSFSTSQR